MNLPLVDQLTAPFGTDEQGIQKIKALKKNELLVVQ
jgi:hypothetical protein